MAAAGNGVPTPEVIRSRVLWLESLGPWSGGLPAAGRRPGRPRGRAPPGVVPGPEGARHPAAGPGRPPAATSAAPRSPTGWLPGARTARFANLFDGPAQVDLSAPIVVFDLKRVVHEQRDADLSRVIFNSIVGTVGQPGARAEPAAQVPDLRRGGRSSSRTRRRPSSWSTASGPCRKTGVSVCAITQGLEDFLANREGPERLRRSGRRPLHPQAGQLDKARLIAQEKNLSARELVARSSRSTPCPAGTWNSSWSRRPRPASERCIW